MMVEIAIGLKLVDQSLEGQVLVLEGGERYVPDAAHNLWEIRIAAQISAQDQSVYEEPD